MKRCLKAINEQNLCQQGKLSLCKSIVSIIPRNHSKIDLQDLDTTPTWSQISMEQSSHTHTLYTLSRRDTKELSNKIAFPYARDCAITLILWRLRPHIRNWTSLKGRGFYVHVSSE